MVRPARIARPLLFVALVAFVGSIVSLELLHGQVDSCTVGFRNSSQSLSAGQAAQCLDYGLGSALLVVVCLLAGSILIWLGWKLLKARLGPRPVDQQEGPVEGAPGRDSRFSVWTWLRAWPASRWLWILVALFFAASFFAASWEYVRLGLNNFQDVTINQQALSSTILGGKPYPFYEAFNCGHHGQCSFLEVHPAFVVYPVAIVYGIAPTAFTLFALQSLALALGALPLYAIAVDVLGSRRLSLAVAGAYLAWVPLSMASLSFHWEAFVPVEMLSIFWLWSRQRYALAAPVVLLSYVTIEATTVMVFFIGLYFFSPWLVRVARRLVGGSTTGSSESKRTALSWRKWAHQLRDVSRRADVYSSLALMLGSVAAYVLLRLFELHGTGWLGLPPVPSAYALPVSSPNTDFVPSLSALSTMWQSKLVFWIVVFLTLGFVPLFAPRSLLLVLPWIAFTVFNVTPGFFRFGDQYLFVPAAALFIGFVFGIGRLRVLTRRFATPAPGPSDESAPRESGVRGNAPIRPWSLDAPSSIGLTRSTGILPGLIVVIIGANLLLNPLNPVSNSIVPNLGGPFPSTYGVDWGPLPPGPALQRLVSLIPANSVVAAPLPVFTWVADDPFAYPMAHFNNPPYNYSLLPDNEATRTAFVLLPYDTPDVDFPGILLADLYNPSVFGVRGCVSDSAVGGVELFERDYSGPAEVFGPPDPLCPNYFFAGSGLTPETFAASAANASSPSGVVIASIPCHKSAEVWNGPGINIPAGQYRLHLVFNAFNATSAPCQTAGLNDSRSLLRVTVDGSRNSVTVPSTQFYRHQFSEESVCTPTCGGWNYWNVTVDLPTPTVNLIVSGTVLIQQYIVQVSYLVISPV